LSNPRHFVYDTVVYRLLIAAALLSGCAGMKVDYSQRTADRLFLHKGMSEAAVIDGWGKPENTTIVFENGQPASVWEYDRIYKQKPDVAYYPRSTFALTFIDGKLRRWLEKQR
jgi:hypothetical protein